MVQAWYMDNSSDDPRLEHHLNPPEYVPIEKLFPLARVEYWKVKAMTFFGKSYDFFHD